MSRRAWTAIAAVFALAANAQDAGQARFVEDAKTVLASDLKDPAAAQFRGLFIGGFNGVQALCGEVNGKNAYGAYVGYRRFFSTVDRNTHAIEEKGSFSFASTYDTFCSSKVADVK